MTSEQIEYLKELADKCRWFKDFANDEAKLREIVSAQEPSEKPKFPPSIVHGYCCCQKSGTPHEETPQCDI